MSRFSFKQYNDVLARLEAGENLESMQIDEGLKDFVKKAVDKMTTPSDADLQKITQAALRGDDKAKTALDDYVTASEKRKDATKSVAHMNAMRVAERIKKIRASQQQTVDAKMQAAQQRVNDQSNRWSHERWAKN